jgi:hypothetical protein
LTYAFLTRILPLLDCRLPLWARVLAAVLAQPAGVIVGHLFQEWRYARDAASRDAVQIPAVLAKWPGGLSLIAAMKKTSYPGQ